MNQRGWTENAVKDTVSNSYATRLSINKATGNSPTVYYNQSGGYVIIDDVEIEIKQKISNCYLELVKPQRFLEVNMIWKYIELAKASPKIKKRISEYLHEFDNDKLYFEMY